MADPNPRPQKCTVGTGGTAVILYCKPPELAPFLGTITPDVGSTMVSDTATVSGHTRRRYRGGPEIAVRSHSRSYTKGDRGQGQTLPGNNAWLEKPAADPRFKDVEQFTFVGTFRNLKAFVKANAAVPCVLRSPWGEPFEIEPLTP